MRELKYYVEYIYIYETWNKVNENKVLSYGETIKNNKKVVFLMSNLQTYYS